MHHTDRKLSVHTNLEKRIVAAKVTVDGIYDNPELTASTKCVLMMKANAVHQALVGLRDESQSEAEENQR